MEEEEREEAKGEVRGQEVYSMFRRTRSLCTGVQ